jgi:phosphoenolpyruvate carboxykinase (ATP)
MPKSTVSLKTVGLMPKGEVYWNLYQDQLIEKAVAQGEGQLTAHGAFVATTGERTGRSANDKFLVQSDPSQDKIWWGDVNKPMTSETFSQIKEEVIGYLQTKETLYAQDLYCGADASERLSIRVINETAWHNAFAANMFIRPSDQELENHQPNFTVLHAPHFATIDKEKYGLNSSVFVLMNFEERLVLIGGTQYAGEIKKSIFSAMNFLLPQKGILTMHCSANAGPGNSAVFFGLSGTGKTTLSADPERALIGDDEHGWGENGVFNFEGGCYAKMVNLSKEAEPEIFATSRMPGTLLENVILDDKGVPDFTDTSLTENTRGSYPIEFIENRVESGKGMHPKNIVFLCADAFGVLPPVSRLTPDQAAYHFMSGYTAKVAGTEMGVTEPQATFSACFGAPFMPSHPSVYAELLSKKIQEHGVTVWLLNTGWIKGAYGAGERISIKWTRKLLNACLDGSLAQGEFDYFVRFGFDIPKSCDGVPSEILNPRNTWSNPEAYDAQADRLAHMYGDNFKQFEAGCTESVCKAGPRPLVMSHSDASKSQPVA